MGALCQKQLMQSFVTMSNPFLWNHASATTTVLHKLPKISLEGSQSTQNFLSQVHLRLKAAVAASAVHLFNYLIASLALSSLFVFPSIFFSLPTPPTPSTAIPEKTWLCTVSPPAIPEKTWFGFFPLNSSQINLSFLLLSTAFAPPYLFLGSVLIFASVPPKPQYLFCPPLVPLFRLSPTNRDCVTSWLEPSSLG